LQEPSAALECALLRDVGTFHMGLRAETGGLLRNGQAAATGYPGFDNGKNNPALQAVTNVGPIPKSSWTIVWSSVQLDHGP